MNRLLKKLQWLHTALVNLESLVEISFLKEKTLQDIQYLVTNQTKSESSDKEIFFLVKNILYAGEFHNNIPHGTFLNASVISKIFIDRKIFYFQKILIEELFIRKLGVHQTLLLASIPNHNFCDTIMVKNIRNFL